MAGGRSRHWLPDFLTQTAAQVVSGLILTVLRLVFAAVWAWVPSLRGYLGATTWASIWLLARAQGRAAREQNGCLGITSRRSGRACSRPESRTSSDTRRYREEVRLF